MKKLKHIVSFVMVFALIFTSIPLTTFKAEAVDSAPSTDIVYGSNGNITRAEWLHDLAVVFDMSVESDAVPDNYFSDLESSHPYYNDIMLTVEFGVVDVEAGGNIFVDDLVSRDFAVTTLNFCLGYQASDEDTYTFSDSSECSSPTDALIAVEHGWVELIDNKFMPELPITSDEAKKMLDNAASVLDVSDIDANYDSKYVFQDDVIVVPEWVNTVEENMTFTIENSPVTISQGNLFAIYENGIPAVYVAENVTNDGNLTIITAKKNEGNDAFKEIDAQGQISSNDMEFYACEDVELTLSESESAPAMRKAPGLKAVKSQVKLKKDINLKTKVPLGKGLEANLTVNIYNPVVNYQLSRSYSYATLEGDTEISYSIKGDLTDALGTKSKKLFTCSVAGIGSFDVTVEMRFSGEIKGKVRGNLTAGLECVRGDRIRAIHVFQQKTCYFAAGAEASIGLKASLGITKLPGLQAYVFAEVGAKASLWSTSYDTAPYRCTHFSAYMYMRFSAYASVNLFGWKKSADYTINVFDEKNSPIKVVHHYEDGVEVPACTRGTSHTRYFTKYDSHYGGSGWTGANGSYGLDGSGNSISLYQYSVNDDNEATITKYNGNSYSVYIPETIDGYTVVKIGNSAFANKSIHDVSIPDSVTEIDSYAFNNCKYLKEVKLSEYLTYLGKRAFGSTAIESIEIPKTLDSCGWTGGFDYDFDGTSVWIYGGPFSHCENLKTITFEKGTTQIAENLFRGCTGLENITIPDTVTEIENNAFEGCVRLTEVSIADNVTKIYPYAFNKCISLKKANLPKSLTYLGERAFGETVIEAIEIPKTLDSCGWTGGFDYDFDGTSVWIYGGPFSHCENLKTITFEKGTTQIAENLFRGCTGLETITVPDTIAEIEKYAFEGCVRLTEVSIPDSVTEIGEHAFKSCVSLPEIIIPNTITKINTCTFENCSSLASVSIPDSVMTIDRYAFSQCVSLPNISIPDSVTNIYECAFNECSSLESVKLPGYIQNIAYNMFQNCTSLKTVEFPSTVTTIQNAAFAGCTSLESFSFQNGKSNLQTIKYNAFQDCASLKEAVLPETINTVENNAFRNCVSLEKVYIPESTRTLGGYVFQGDELLKDVTISDYSITKINECTFKDCPALASIVLPKGLTEIGNQAFMNDTALFDVTIPESVTSITNSAFSYPAKTIIHGKAGSYAETFANDGGFKFNDIGIAAEGISLIDGIENITLDVGETYRAKFEFYPEDANDVVTMTSDNRNVSINGHDIKANYSGNSVITATSSSGIPYEFNIHTRSPRKITIKTPANKLSYLIGEEFERTGLVAEVTYDDNSTKDVTDFTISGFDSYAEGSCTVTLSWLSANGYTYKTTFSVEIVDPTPKLTGITIKSVPNKLMYERKESLNLTGLSVIGTYSDDSNREITDYTISGYNALKYGKQTITVSYNEKTATFTVAVKCATHTFNEWTTEKEPICTESGKKVHICSVCGLVEEEVIPATGHDYKTVVIEPTYTEQGYTLHTCSHCGDSYKDNYTEKLIEQLANDSVLSAETIKLGETITATGKATGGTAPYQYQVVYKKSADSKWTTAQSYKANTTVTFKPASATTYDVCIKVKDSTGTEVKKFFNINVSSILTNNSTISATSIGLGSTLTATGKANGGTAPYQYQVVYKKSTDSKWTTAQSYKANTTVTFKPASATTYDVCIKVKDSTGTEVKKFFTVKVTDALKNNSVISKTEISLGDTITVSGKATGGTSPYQYNILYKQTAQSKWTTVQSYKTNSTVTIKPAKATTYDVCVKIKDSNGTIVKKFFTVQVNAKLANTSTISATEIKKGNTVTVNGSATGGAGNYTYAVFYKQKAQTQWTTKQDFNENTNVSIKPMLATDYDICVKVKDKNGTIAKQYFTVTVTK